MKKVVLIALVLALMLSGCAQRNPDPDSTVPGYYGQGQTLEGGSGSQKNANLADVSVSRRQEDVLITLTFREGSIVENAAAPLCEKLPSYTVEALTAPSRIAVHLPITIYEFLGEELPSMGEFLGMMTQEEEDGITLYFQFTGQVAYKVAEEEGALVLQVRADDAPSVEQYHVKMQHNDENAALAAEYGMTMALCDDAIHIYDLTGGMETLEEADALCQTLNAALEEAGSDETAEVIFLNSGKAPVYTEPVSRSMLTMMGALRTEDGVLDGELVAMDARFLCWNDDGSMVMARPQVEVAGDGSTQTYEEIWVYNLDGKRERLIDTAFASVQKAAFSPDGRYIALLEQSDGARLLYLYDRMDQGLVFLSAEGVGDYTSDFAWSDGGVLYAMCGSDTMQLMAYDPALAEAGQEPLTAVEEREGGYGNVGVSGNTVYFNDEYGNIYAVDAQTGSRELFDVGDGFLLSPDGTRMVLIVYEDGENQSLATLYLCDLTTGTRMQIASQAALSDYVWSADGKVLFYLVSNKDAQDAADYPVRLMRYSTVDGKTTDLGALASNSIFQGRTQDYVIIMYYQNRNNVFYPITYELNLTELTNHTQDELIVTIDEEE